MLCCNARRKNRPARGPRFHQPHRKLRRTLQRDNPPAGMHQKDRASGPFGSQAFGQTIQIGFHQGLDIGIGDGGVEAFILAHLGRDFARKRNHHPRQAVFQHGTDQPFMGGVGIGMQQPNRDALIARRAQSVAQTFHLGTVQGDQHIAPRADPFSHSVAPIARQQRFGQR